LLFLRLLYDTHGLERLEVELVAMKTAQQRSQADLYTIKRSSEVLALTLILAAIKRGHTGRHQVHINFYFQREGARESIHMCRFYLYEIIWSVYLCMMLRSMHINTELFVL
jgi:hypothetical protein